MNSKQQLGQWGEDIAVRYYTNAGYFIVDRNYRCRAGEIELIVRRGRSLYLVEVKTRSSDLFGMPEEAITLKKLERMYRCADYIFDDYYAYQSYQVEFHVCAIRITDTKIIVRIYTEIE